MSRAMNFDVTATTTGAEREFRQLADAAERLEDKLRRLDQLSVNPTAQLNITPATRSAQQLQQRFEALRNVRATVEVSGAAEARRDVTALVVEMRKVRNTTATIDVRTGTARADVTAIADKLRTLRDMRIKVDIDLGSSDSRLRTIEARLVSLRSLSPLKIEVRVDEANRALQRIAAIRTAALALSNARPNIQVTADTAAALAQMTALLASVRRLSQPEHQIRIRLEETSFLSQMARIQTELRTLAGGTFEINADTRAAMTQLANLRVRLAELQASEQTVQVRADTANAQTQIAMLEARLASIAGEQYTANVRVDVDNGALAKIAKIGAALALIPAAAGLATASLGGTGAAVLSLGGSVVALTGTLGLLPAAGAAGGAAMATFALGLAHVADALGPTGTPAQVKKVNEALAALSPAAREAVDTIRGLGSAFSEMRSEVQERLFAGMAKEIDSVSRTYLPVLKDGLGGIAEELNLGAKNFTAWVSEGKTISDLNTILGLTRTTMRELAPAGTNVAAALTDIAVVGSGIMPELAAGATAATERFREFIAEARKSGELEQWIRGGMETMRQLGSVVGNTGSILGSMFRAAKDSGADFLSTLDRVTGSMATFLRSAEGQSAMVDFFRESRSAIDEILPGLEALGRGALDAVQAFANTGGLTAFGEAFSSISARVAPLIAQIGELAGGTLAALASGAGLAATALQPIISGVSGLVSGLGPVAPLVLASVVAFRSLALLSAPLATLSTTIAGLSIASGWGAASAAVAGFGAAVGAVGRALPIVGVAAVALGFALQGMSTSTSDAVAAMQSGGAAAENMRAALEAQSGVAQAGRSGFDDWANSVNTWVNSNIFGIASVESTTEAMARQRSEMSSLQRAQADLTTAQGEYQAALDRFPASSPQVQAAANELADATRRVQIEQIAARNATDLHTAAMIQQSDQALAAIDAGRGYEGALLNLERAQIRAAEATRDYGAGSLEAREANFALEGQMLLTAEAAGEVARANGEAAGAANLDELAARAQKDELLRLAAANTGPVRDALLTAANAIDISATASSRAEGLARTHKDELGRLADQANGGTSEALRNLVTGFDNLGGANATAEQRARAQEKALRDMAATASGPLRDSLLRMADQIRDLPSGSFTVTANGQLGSMFNADGSFKGSAGRMATGGVWAGPGRVVRAADGAVLPGYTPGRDVHSFASPTGGRLELSGGEAVMRPEWTRAVGPAFVAGANRAARAGGVAGARAFMARPAQRFAFGGIVRTGPAYSALVSQDHRGSAEEAARRMAPVVAAAVKRYEEAAQAAAAAAASAGPGGSYSGGPPGAGVERWRPMVGQALGIVGQPQAAQNITLRRMNQESGGNPNAINRTDINWTRGTPSVGLMQVIGPTYRSYRHPSYDQGPYSYGSSLNPLSNTLASMRYALARYGSLASAYNRSGGYASGGVLPTKLADRGGLIPSGMAAMNLSGRAERMLSPRQTEVFERLVAAISSRRGNFEARLGPLPVATPIGSNPMATQLQAAMLAPRPVMTGGGPRIDLGVVVRELAQMRAESRGRPPVVVNQTFPGGQDTTSGSRDAALGIKLALG